MSKKARYPAQIGGITLNSTSKTRVLREIGARIEGDKKTFVVTPNPEFIVYAQERHWFKKILNQADFAIPDGIGLVWASRFLAYRVISRPVIKERISGTDLMKKLCQEAAKRNWSVYLLGGQAGVAKKTLEVLQKRYSGLKGWAESGPKLEIRNSKLIGKSKLEMPASRDSFGMGNLVKRINARRPDLLFVGFGMGKQEKFIWDNWDKLDVKLAMGVGGAFDYLSGQIPRAPKWVQKTGFEWLFRLIREPWRWRRQLRLIEFAWLVNKEKFSS